MTKLRRSLHVVLIAGIVGAFGAAATPATANPVMESYMKSIDKMFNGRNSAPLGKMLMVVSVMAPDEFKEWEPISKAGAAAAQRGDYVAVRKACADCHDKYREQYKAKTASFKIPKH